MHCRTSWASTRYPSERSQVTGCLSAEYRTDRSTLPIVVALYVTHRCETVRPF